MEISMVRIGGISSPELGGAHGLVVLLFMDWWIFSLAFVQTFQLKLV